MTSDEGAPAIEGAPPVEGGRLSDRLSRADAARRAADPATALTGSVDAPDSTVVSVTEGAGAATPSEAATGSVYRSAGLGFRTRLTLALIAAAVLPVAGFGAIVLLVTDAGSSEAALPRVLLLAITLAIVFAVLLAALLAADLGAPLRAIAKSVEQVSAGDLATHLELPGDDEFSRLAESHNRMARDLARRNRELRQIVVALEAMNLRERPDVLSRTAVQRAREAFGMIDCELLALESRDVPEEELVPGDPIPVRADLTAAGEHLGVLVGHLPATRRWERADQDLFELFAIEVAAAIRNAQLFAQVDDQNRQLLELDEAKDDFLRGVSHNLQTPLASIRGYAQQLEAEAPDRRLGIITEQADRLSRMVRQLLTVSRIESGALRPGQEVFAPAARVRRTWEALGVVDVAFAIDDRSGGWLAVADPDQLDQVLWALLDNAVVYGNRTPIDVTVDVDGERSEVLIAIADHGSGISSEDRARLFLRFERGAARPTGEGSGLGLYVSRELCRAMDGDLELAPAQAGVGAAFVIRLPGEAPEET